jgi:hypothetical protein
MRIEIEKLETVTNQIMLNKIEAELDSLEKTNTTNSPDH